MMLVLSPALLAQNSAHRHTIDPMELLTVVSPKFPSHHSQGGEEINTTIVILSTSTRHFTTEWFH